MTASGTAAYANHPDLPPLVAVAVDAALLAGFDHSCLPDQGELLRVLARGIGGGVIGETGTRYGAGLAWRRAPATWAEAHRRGCIVAE